MVAMTKPKHEAPDHHLQTVERTIRQHGYFITSVLGDQHHPCYCYTTGFLHIGHPELVAIGLDPNHVQFVFDRLYAEAKKGPFRAIGRHAPNELEGAPIRLLPVPPRHFTGTDCMLLGFASYYGHHPELVKGEHLFLQLVWPDHDLRLPWDDDVAWRVWRDQPILADGDEPVRKVPIEPPIDNSDQCVVCRSAGPPQNRAERRRRSRRR
jgi:hypothetical protein